MNLLQKLLLFCLFIFPPSPAVHSVSSRMDINVSISGLSSLPYRGLWRGSRGRLWLDTGIIKGSRGSLWLYDWIQGIQVLSRVQAGGCDWIQVLSRVQGEVVTGYRYYQGFKGRLWLDTGIIKGLRGGCDWIQVLSRVHVGHPVYPFFTQY